jgi:hypothetical protein
MSYLGGVFGKEFGISSTPFRAFLCSKTTPYARPFSLDQCDPLQAISLCRTLCMICLSSILRESVHFALVDIAAVCPDLCMTLSTFYRMWNKKYITLSCGSGVNRTPVPHVRLKSVYDA